MILKTQNILGKILVCNRICFSINCATWVEQLTVKIKMFIFLKDISKKAAAAWEEKKFIFFVSHDL